MNISNGQLWKYSSFIQNENHSFNKDKILEIITKEQIDDAYLTISNWKSYNPTPLLVLNKLSKELSLNNIYYKDESKRFDLKSFKALGGAYAVEKITKGNKNTTVSTATAGNHGRSVAWGAQRLGLKCKIFISEFVSDARGKAMEALGADGKRNAGPLRKLTREAEMNLPADILARPGTDGGEGFKIAARAAVFRHRDGITPR